MRDLKTIETSRTGTLTPTVITDYDILDALLNDLTVYLKETMTGYYMGFIYGNYPDAYDVCEVALSYASQCSNTFERIKKRRIGELSSFSLSRKEPYDWEKDNFYISKSSKATSESKESMNETNDD